MHLIWQALRSIYATEGVVGGLYKGLTLTWLKGPVQSALGFTVNDWCKKQLREAGGAPSGAPSGAPAPSLKPW